MSQVLRLSNGAGQSIDLMTDLDAYALLPGLDLGNLPDDDRPRVITLPIWVGAADHDTAWQRISAIERLLLEASTFRSEGLGRRVTLEFTPDGAEVPTFFDLLSGRIDRYPDLSDTTHLLKHWVEPLVVLLEVEPFGRSTETTVLPATTLYGRSAGLTHRYLHYSGATAFSEQLAPLIESPLWQRTHFTTSPANATPQNGDIQYFGNTLGQFDRLVMGLRTAGVGNYVGVWEYWNGSAWTAFVPTSNSFRSGPGGSFPATGNLDSFNRANENPLAPGTWARMPGSAADWKVVSNQAGNGAADDATYADSYWTTQFSGDVEAYFTLATLAPDTYDIYLSIFTDVVTSNQPDGYQLAITKVAGAANDTLKLLRKDNGAGTQLGSTLTEELVAGLSVGLVRRGTSIELWTKAPGGAWAQRLAVTDATYAGPAYASMTCRHRDWRIDDFGGGAVGLGREWDTPSQKPSAIVFPTLAGWVQNAVNSVTAYWARWRVTAFTSMTTVPAFCNGPIRSRFGIGVIPAALVGGDVPARARVQFANPNATAKAGVITGISTGHLADEAQPFSVPVSAADLFQASGDTTVQVQADADADFGERVTVSPLAAISDYAQTFAGDQYVTVTPGAGDKLSALGANSFFAEIMFRPDLIRTAPSGLVSQWNANANLRSWWLGLDNRNRLRCLASPDGLADEMISLAGGTISDLETWAMATFEYDEALGEIRLWRNASVEGNQPVNLNIFNGGTTAVRVGKSADWKTSESLTGSDDEARFSGAVGYVFVYADTVANFCRDVLGGAQYSVPTTPRTNTGATVKWLLQMNDNAATTTIVDGSNTPLNPARNSGNTSANRIAGPFVAGVTPEKIVGLRLPQCYAEEYAGTYHVYLLARPETGSTLANLGQVEFFSQFSVGDAALGYHATARRFPDTAAPTGGYYPIDLGQVTLPPTALYDGHRGSGSARLQLHWHLFMRHGFTATGKKIYLDSLVFVPVGTWWDEYRAWRDTRQSGYEIIQNAGVAFDGRHTEPVVYPITTAGAAVQDRNPYARTRSGRPVLHPRRTSFVYALSLRGADSNNDYLFRAAGDSLTVTIDAVPLVRGLASP